MLTADAVSCTHKRQRVSLRKQREIEFSELFEECRFEDMHEVDCVVVEEEAWHLRLAPADQ
jgi:hypothetical protein